MKKWYRLLIAVLLLGSSTFAFAEKTQYKCAIELSKGSCWDGYAINLSIRAGHTDLQKFTLEKSESKKQFEFVCGPRQVIYIEASTTPGAWNGADHKDNRVYPSLNRWSTPFSVDDTTSTWVIGACFHKDFYNAPRPINDAVDCKCPK